MQYRCTVNFGTLIIRCQVSLNEDFFIIYTSIFLNKEPWINLSPPLLQLKSILPQLFFFFLWSIYICFWYLCFICNVIPSDKIFFIGTKYLNLNNSLVLSGYPNIIRFIYPASWFVKGSGSEFLLRRESDLILFISIIVFHFLLKINIFLSSAWNCFL